MVCEAKGKKRAKSKGNGKSKPNGKDALKPKKGISKEAKCFYCEKFGHWKRNCPFYLEEVKKSKANGAPSSAANTYSMLLTNSRTHDQVDFLVSLIKSSSLENELLRFPKPGDNAPKEENRRESQL
ncbi:hypothetical protein V6N11_055221 [Hibiscus sabdariffa]|uniref:CCHC-type domain-containing protein n=1 Tax=Hibiscus sabdariffa TaxID=183260 RepID=A0ABR2PES6_9ROSI